MSGGVRAREGRQPLLITTREHCSGFLQGCIVLLCVGAMCLCMSSCGKPSAPGGSSSMGRPSEPAPVRVAAVTRQSVPLELSDQGRVEAYSIIQVKAQVSGELTEVHFLEGDMVEQGQILFAIDKRPFEIKLREAEANLARVQAQLEQATANKARDVAQAENAKVELERDAALIKKGMVSQEEYDKVKSTVEALNAAVAADDAAIKAAVQSIESAKTAIDDARLQLDYCTICSPIRGRTGSLLVHRGNLVKANDTNPLVTITQTQPIYVNFTLPEKDLLAVREAMGKGSVEVRAVAPKHEDTPAVGTLTFVDNTVNKTTGTIRLKATFENNDELLWPGLFVRVAVQVGVEQDAVVAPAASIQPGQDGAYAYVVNGDMTAELRQITAGVTWGGVTVVKQGLNPDEQVIVDGVLRVTPGAAVRIVADEPDVAKDKP